MLVIQTVELVWTKASRGAGGGDWRAGVERALPIDLRPGDGACVIQEYRLHAGDAFQPELRRRESLPHVPGKEGYLRIRTEGNDSFVLGFAGNDARYAPPGWHEVPTALRLETGGFMRFIVNARMIGSNGRQWYSETTYNLAAGSDVAPDRFNQCPPSRVVDLRGHLF